MAPYLAVANFDESQKYDFTAIANKVRYISGSMSDTTSELGEPVELRFQTITRGTAIQIRESLRQAELIFSQAPKFLQNLTSQQSIWMYVSSEGERKRRALVLSWQRVDTVQGSSDPMLDKSLMIISDWIVTRKGYWEATLTNIYAPSLGSGLKSGAAQGGVYSGGGVAINTDSTVLAKGTAPGRIRTFRFSLPAVYTTKYFDKLWMGIKTVATQDTPPTKYFKGFEPFDNVYGNPDVYNAYIDQNYTTGVSSIALNNNCANIHFDSPADPTWQNRISHQIPNYGTTPDNQAGTYQILFRMRASDAAGKFRVAMFQSWDLMDELYAVAETFQDVFVESNEFHLYEMGVVQIPPENFRSARRNNYLEMYQLNIGLAAERLSAAGNGTLQLDYMIWIPQEHSISLSGIRSKTTGGCEVITDEEDVIFGATTSWGTVWEKFVHEVAANNWTFPAEGTKVPITVVAADVKIGDGHHPMFEDLSIQELKVIPRYHSFNTDTYS